MKALRPVTVGCHGNLVEAKQVSASVRRELSLMTRHESRG